MPEILHRAQCEDSGAWVYGYYVKLHCSDKHLASHRIYTGYAETDCGDFYPDWYEVDPKTVGRNTGLTDVNGEEIFEGDIVQCWDEYNSIEFWAIVVFGNPNCTDSWGWALKLLRGDEPNLDILCWVGMEDTGAFCEVIGNIHDNPELLTEVAK